MTTDTVEEQAAGWKQKYLDTLDEFERGQRAWQEAEELLNRTIGRLALAARGIDQELDEHLDRVRLAIRDGTPRHLLVEHIDALSKALLALDHRRAATAAEPVADPAPVKADAGTGFFRRLFGHEESPADPKTEANDGDGVTAERLLLDLLDRLDLPEFLDEQAIRVRQHIAAGLLDRDWRDVLQEIADLIEALRCHARQENAGMQEFLSQVSARLQEFDQHLRGSLDLQQQGVDNRNALDAAVRREVQDINTSVRDAVDIGQLKSAVQARMESVTAQMLRFREAENTRDAATRDHLDGMRKRIEALETETRELRDQVDMERLQATTDALTEIPNRLAYEQRLKEDMARRRRFGTSLILLVWDVDHFKGVNDSFGHKAGDKVLKKIAQILHNRARETDFVARYGGEEFVMLMTGTTMKDGVAVANQLRMAVAKTGFHFRGQAVNITVSCGLAELGDRDTAGDLFERADRALYQAKEQGRNRCVVG